MTSAERGALIVGEDLARVDAVVPLLRRLNLDVRRAVRGSAASKIAHEGALDLVVVVLPFRQARDFLMLVRGPRSPCRHAAVLLVRGGESMIDDEGLSPLANRELPGGASAEEFLLALDLLLNVAPRVEMHTSLRMRLGGSPADQPRVAQVENLSTSGMLLSAPEALPVGSVFGFELDLPSQKDPIRGRAQVVRHASSSGGRAGLGASFLSLGGEGPERLKNAVFRERAAAGARPWIDGNASGPADLPAPSPADRVRAGRASAADVLMVQEQLAELEPMLDELLRQGLHRRLGGADWYVTGVELGLESLRAFSAVLETVYRGNVSTMETSKRNADLVQVRERLGEFAKPGQDVKRRTEILLEIRPPLERLLRELGEEGSSAGADQSSASRRRGVVSQLNVDIGRLARSRRSLDEMRGQLLDLSRPRYALARGTLRRRAAEISRQYRGYGSSLHLDLPQLLVRRQGRKEALAAVEHEIQRMDDWLAAIHGKVYTPKFARMASGDHAKDFATERLHPVLAETLAAGYEYLVRAYSAYRHALEAIGADARLLDRVAGLAASIAHAPQPPAASVRQAPAVRPIAGEPPHPRLTT